MLKREELHAELEKIRSQDPHEKLRPEAVVTCAMLPTSRLHAYFEWDDGEAADRYRLAQARQLIRITVIVLPNTNEEVRAYCSLTPDRNSDAEDGGGYRSTVEVMSDARLQAILLDDALSELKSFEIKYRRLVALAPVLAAARKAVAKAEKAAARKAKKTKKKKTTARKRTSRASAGRKKATKKRPARAGRK